MTGPACYNSPKDDPSCAVCRDKNRDHFVFVLGQPFAESNYYFCWDCAGVPDIPVWIEKHGHVMTWLEEERPQVRLV